jgi:heterotetrameric sarcosine oxidase gamma subunit
VAARTETLSWQAPAESAVATRPPLEEWRGWLVSNATASGDVRLVDCSPVSKIMLRAQPAGGVARQLSVEPGRAARFEEGILVTCSAPGEWSLFCDIEVAGFLRRLRTASTGEHLAAVDVTHGRTLLRLTGPSAGEVLSSISTFDLSDWSFPPGAAAHAPVAGVRTGLVRDDLASRPDAAASGAEGEPEPMAVMLAPSTPAGSAGAGPVPSYLLHCDRSLGRHLYDELRSAGERFGLQIEGFAAHRTRSRF